jgi:hypothetical protein
VFLKLSETADHYMGGWPTGGPPICHNIPHSCKDHAIALLYANRRNIIVKVAINYFVFIHQFKGIFRKNVSSQLF